MSKWTAAVCAALAITSMALPAADKSAAGADFTGIWLPDAGRASPWPTPLPLTAAARQFMERFDPAEHDPTTFCMPFGTPRNMLQSQYPLQIVQTPQRLVMVLQPDLSNAEVRRVPFTEALPEDPQPAWFGTSRGRWQGSTLVIETVGLREDSLVDGSGLPHSAELRIIERLSIQKDKSGGKVLVNEIELHDPQSYSEPLRTRRYYAWAPQARLTEGSCVARRWIDKLWRDRLGEHAEAARAAKATP